MQPSGWIRNSGAAWSSMLPGWPATMTFGLPVEPPRVGARGHRRGDVPHRSTDAIAEGIGVSAEHDWRIGQLDDGSQLASREPCRPWLRNGADTPRGYHRNKPINGVLKSDGDQVPELDAILVQLPGEGIGRNLKLCSA